MGSMQRFEGEIINKARNFLLIITNLSLIAIMSPIICISIWAASYFGATIITAGVVLCVVAIIYLTEKYVPYKVSIDKEMIRVTFKNFSKISEITYPLFRLSKINRLPPSGAVELVYKNGEKKIIASIDKEIIQKMCSLPFLKSD